MAINTEKMLDKIVASQWALADIDWDAPGADRITDAQRPALKRFMTDLVWIEQIGARGFASMARKAPDETLRQIYLMFFAEEQRHANAELALMRRWGMLEDGKPPQPSVNIRISMRYLDQHADGMAFSMTLALISMLEFALDGALLKFLLEEVHDPVCHQVFEKINADEARHLGLDFHVLELIGMGPQGATVLDALGAGLKPPMWGAMLCGLLPFISGVEESLDDMGLAPEKLQSAFIKFCDMGRRNPHIQHNVGYRLISRLGIGLSTPDSGIKKLGATMRKLTAPLPDHWFGGIPLWSQGLTWQPKV